MRRQRSARRARHSDIVSDEITGRRATDRGARLWSATLNILRTPKTVNSLCRSPRKKWVGRYGSDAPDPAQWGWPTDGPRWATTHTDGDAHDHMTVSKTQTLSG